MTDAEIFTAIKKWVSGKSILDVAFGFVLLVDMLLVVTGIVIIFAGIEIIKSPNALGIMVAIMLLITLVAITAKADRGDFK